MLEKLSEADITSITKIIIHLSAGFAQRFPFLVLDDCIQVAWHELIQYQEYYDHNKGKVTSWVYKLVRDTLTSYAQREYKKTQSWTDIEDYQLFDKKDTKASDSCEHSDLVATLKELLSPRCFCYLKQLQDNPKISLAELSNKLKLSDRDLICLRNELRVTTQHIMDAQ